MNLILVEESELRPDGTVRIDGRRAHHLAKVLKTKPGDKVRIGCLNGLCGQAELLAWEGGEALLQCELTDPPPARPGIDLLLAVPRPKALKRVLSTAAMLGVDRMILINAARTEKSFFQSAALEPSTVHRLFLEGAEQARDTRLPQLLLRALSPFSRVLQDELDELLGPAALRLLPHPVAPSIHDALELPSGDRRIALAVGPEGGWVPFEVDLLQAHGFCPVSLGPRILRVETAVPYLIGLIAGMKRDLRAAPPLPKMPP